MADKAKRKKPSKPKEVHGPSVNAKTKSCEACGTCLEERDWSVEFVVRYTRFDAFSIRAFSGVEARKIALERANAEYRAEESPPEITLEGIETLDVWPL